MDARREVFALAAATGVLLALSAWLFTHDIQSDIGRQYVGDRRPEPGPSMCGSAYDVVLLEGDGFMGGEVPVNRWAIDRDCVRQAGRLVALASVSGTLALGTGAAAGYLAFVRSRRRRRVAPVG